MTDAQIDQAARLWNLRCDTLAIARALGCPEPLVYLWLWNGIIAKAIAIRPRTANTAATSAR